MWQKPVLTYVIAVIDVGGFAVSVNLVRIN